MRRQGTEPSILILVIHPIFAPVPSMGQQVKLTTKERMERMGNFESSSLTRPTGCSRRFDPIRLWSASSGAYGGSIWITYSIGMPGTWNENWSCSGATLMRPARTKVWAEIPRRRKPGVQRRRWPDLRITAGKAIVTVWFTCQLLPDQQFAMYRFNALGFDHRPHSFLCGNGR
jgi:hypothetical protein